MKKYNVKVNGNSFEIAVNEITLGDTAPTPTAVSAVSAPTQSAVPKAESSKSVPQGEGKKVLSPMPGTVLKVKTPTGTVVTTGQPILLLEAMKMENEIVAPTSGTVTVCVSEGTKVNSEDILATIV